MLFIQLVFIQLVIFGVLAAVLRYVLTRHIKATSSHLELLTQDLEKKLEEAKRRKEEADRYYQEVLTTSRGEAELLKQKLIKEGQEAKQELIEQGRQEADETMKRARVASEAILQDLDQMIEQRGAEKAYQLMQELLPGKMSEQLHSDWLEGMIKGGLEALEKMNVSASAKEAQVATAFPLKDNEKTLLQNELNKRLGRHIRLREEVVPQLILGIRVTIDSVVIDGSLLFKIQESLRRIHASR